VSREHLRVAGHSRTLAHVRLFTRGTKVSGGQGRGADVRLNRGAWLLKHVARLAPFDLRLLGGSELGAAEPVSSAAPLALADCDLRARGNLRITLPVAKRERCSVRPVHGGRAWSFRPFLVTVPVA